MNNETHFEDELTLDGNSVAGMLHQMLGIEMTETDMQCATCSNVAALGAQRAFTQAPGVVLRCVACGEVLMRVVQTPRGTLFEARGTASFHLPIS